MVEARDQVGGAAGHGDGVPEGAAGAGGGAGAGAGVGARFGQVVRSRREGMGLSLQRVAELMGCAKSYLSAIENGKRGVPGDEFVGRLAMCLMLSEEQLLEAARWERSLEAGGDRVRADIEQLRAQAAAAARLAALLRRSGGRIDEAYRSGELRSLVERMGGGPEEKGPEAAGQGSGGGDGGDGSWGEPATAALPMEVPLINVVPAGRPAELTDLGYPARVADGYVRTPDVGDPDAFAAKVVGDSMEPTYREGDIVVFSPARAVTSGADCFARLERDGETTFKRVYFESGAGGEAMIRLQPLNSAYPPRVVGREEVAGLFAAVCVVRRI